MTPIEALILESEAAARMAEMELRMRNAVIYGTSHPEMYEQRATLASPCGSLGEEADAPAAHWQILEAIRLRAEQECKQRARERELSKPRLTPHGAEPWDLAAGDAA